jgi:hypothetical protein
MENRKSIYLDILEEPEGFLPFATKIASRTIGLDLIQVTPMESPKINLTYIDYKHNDKKIARNFKNIWLKLKNKLISLWKGCSRIYRKSTTWIIKIINN